MSDLVTRMNNALPIRWTGVLATITVALLLAGPVFMVSPAFARIPDLQNVTQPDKKESKSESGVVSPEQQREITKRLLAATLAERVQALAASPDIPRQEVKEKYRLLDGLVTRLNSQLNLLDELEELRRTRTAAEQKAKSWAGFPEPPPYPVLMVDELTGSVLTARARVQGLSTSREILARQVSEFRESSKQAREMERQALDESEQAQSSEAISTAAWQKELMGLRTRNADAMAVLIALRHEVLGERLKVAEVELGLLERQLAEAGKRMVFSRADLDKTLARLKSIHSGLEREMETALARDARSRSGLAQSKQELDSFTLRHDTGDTSAKTVALRNELAARRRAALAWVESSRYETEVIAALIAINRSGSKFWEQRYTAVTGADAEKRRTILAGFRKNLERLKPWQELAQHQLELYQAAEREQKARLAVITGQGPLRAAETDLLAARQLQSDLAERHKAAVEQAALERKTWLEDIERKQQTRSIIDRTRDGLRAFPHIFRKVWRFELFAIEDSVEVAGQKVVTSRGVTIGKSAGALFLFIIGYVLTLFLCRRVQLMLVSRFGIGGHQANVIRRWLMALTIFILLIITLNIARIPLTIFAFLGGALVIGVGFGTQTLIKNFISGILILLERNIKVGDTIDVDGVVGRIVTVDTRASTVLGFDGVETVIPNSMFLENKVTNWTHTNSSLRRIVKVGVAYGSQTVRVRDILTECGNGHEQILKDPPPEAFFEDFGDNALIFSLYFWIDYGPEVNPVRVASDLRFMIAERFAGENIALAFPQRDVHLDSARPLRIEVVAPAGGKR